MTNTDDILHRILAVSEGARHQSQHALTLSGQALALASALDQIEELILSSTQAEADETANEDPFTSLFPDFEASINDLMSDLRSEAEDKEEPAQDDNPVHVFLNNLPQSADQIKTLLEGKLPTEGQINEKLKELGLDKLIEKGLGFGFGFVPDSK